MSKGHAMKKNVIWGTGYNASKLFAGLNRGKVSFFIDSDVNKSNTQYLGKKVLNPRDVHNWEKLFIYVPDNYYDEIKELLITKNLIEHSDFEKYDNKVIISEEQAIDNYEAAVRSIHGKTTKWNNQTIYIALHSFVKSDYRKYISYLLRTWGDLKIISGAYWMREEEQHDVWNTDIINSPFVLDDYCKVVSSKDKEPEGGLDQYIKDTALQIAYIHNEKDANKYLIQAIIIKNYFDTLISSTCPARILMYNSVSPSSIILDNICKKCNLPIIFTHPGIIPGTLSFDVNGEMGESIPAVQWEKFSRLAVTAAELEYAKLVWDYLYKSKLNRKIQPQNEFTSALQSYIKPNRPIIFYAGQNDVFSHMVPYTERTKKYHSPNFTSSLEAALFLADLCEKNDWNLIYKPHPMYTQPEQIKQLPSNVIFLEYGDINALIDMSNVVVTILSSTNYNALVRYKPVVMLGYNQTRGKGCTYEAFKKDRIEDTIKTALSNGFTQEQQDAFLLHMAQCLKYYLYDDLQERPIRYGRPVPKSIDEFYELERLLQAEDVRKEPT